MQCGQAMDYGQTAGASHAGAAIDDADFNPLPRAEQIARGALEPADPKGFEKLRMMDASMSCGD